MTPTNFLDLKLSGQAAWVLGASGAIGSAIAVMLAELGVRVCLSGRNETKLQEVCDRITRAGGQASIRVLEWLASPLSDYMNGIVLPLDGGSILSPESSGVRTGCERRFTI